MNDKREIKNAVIAAVIGSLIFSVFLWCFNHFSEWQSDLQQLASLDFARSNSSEFIVVSILLVLLFFLRKIFRPTLQSRARAYRKKFLKFIRFN